MKLLCTISATDAVVPYEGITLPRMYSYAKRWGADFMAVTQPSFGTIWDASNDREGNPSTWKVPLIKWFAGQNIYSGLAFVDADVFIRKNSPSIFEAMEGDGEAFHACPDMFNEREFPHWRQWAQERYGLMNGLCEADFYLNAGVWCVSKNAAVNIAQSMDLFPVMHTRWLEQDYLQLMARHAGPVKKLPHEFNVAYPYMTHNPDDGHFLHCCGLGHHDKIPWLARLESLGI